MKEKMMKPQKWYCDDITSEYDDDKECYSNKIECTILSYDNDKYITAKLITGEVVNYKSYYFTNIKGRYLNRRELFKFGGGNPKYYNPRLSKTTWRVWDDSSKKHIFHTKKQAIKFAINLAKLLEKEIEITSNSYKKSSIRVNDTLLIVYGDGYVQQFHGNVRRTRGCFNKMLRGHGKVMKG
jgi:hypothetical protein